METKITLFKELSIAQFASAVKWFKTNAEKAKLHLENASAFAAGRLYATGDVKHINKLAPVVEAFGFGPKFRRCVVPFICFAYDKDSLQFTGSIQKGKRGTLETLNADGVPNWEAGMRQKFDEEREKKAPAAFVLATAITNAIKKDRKQDLPHDDAAIRKLVTEALRAFPMQIVKEVEVQQVKEGQAQEAVDIKRAAAKERKAA